MIRSHKLLTLTLLGALALPPPLLAQTAPDEAPQEPDRPGKRGTGSNGKNKRKGNGKNKRKGNGKNKRKNKRARLAAVKKKVLEQRVGLTREEADAVLKLFVEQEKPRRALRRRLRKANLALRKLIAGDSRDDDAYTTSLDELMRARAELFAHREQQLKALDELLTPRKRVRLLAAMRKVQKRMNRPGIDP